jgi:hypothetical protein
VYRQQLSKVFAAQSAMTVDAFSKLLLAEIKVHALLAPAPPISLHPSAHVAVSPAWAWLA